MDLDFRVQGDRELLRKLNAMSKLGQASVLAEAVGEASEPIITDAKGRAPSAIIAEGIRLVRTVINERGKVTAEIGLPGGRKPWFHGLFIERGTGPRVQKKSGRRTGSMPARPFLRPAFDAQRKAAQALFGISIRRKLAQIASVEVTRG